MQIEFYKYHGTGNDFIIIDNRALTFPKETKVINHLCSRHFGVGADGLILLEQMGKVISMVYYNSDGNESTMCGNGGRCFTAFAKTLNLFENLFEFEAIDGLHEATINQNIVKLKMADVNNVIELDEKVFELNTGSPHYVKIMDNMPTKFLEEARAIRYSKRYANEGINVNFLSFHNNQWHIRTYERGVENETLSCGTGNVAGAIALNAFMQIKSPITLNTLGGKLAVYFEKKEQGYKNVFLQGETALVFKGSVNL